MQNTWDHLEQRLIELKTAIQQSKYTQQESLLQETGDLIRNLSEQDRQAITPEHKERIVQMYQQCHLMLAAHRQQTGEQLKRVRSGKRTVQAYGNHL